MQAMSGRLLTTIDGMVFSDHKPESWTEGVTRWTVPSQATTSPR